MRTLILCLVAALSLSLFACGESESKPAPAAPAKSAVVPPAPATQPSEPEEAATQTSELPRPTNTKCPVSGEEVDPANSKLIVVDYKGKTYGLCCKDCIDEFNKHPEKYTK